LQKQVTGNARRAQIKGMAPLRRELAWDSAAGHRFFRITERHFPVCYDGQ